MAFTLHVRVLITLASCLTGTFALLGCSAGTPSQGEGATEQSIATAVYNFGTLASPGKCLDVAGAGTRDGTNIHSWTCNGTGAQSFRVENLGNNEVRIVNTHANKCVDVSASGTADGTNIQLWSCNSTGAQKFRIDDIGGGNVRIVNPQNNKCVDVAGAGTQDGTNVQLWTCNGTNAQAWRPADIGNPPPPPPPPPPPSSGGSTAGLDTGFFMWDENTSASVIEAAIAANVRSFRSRDLTIVTGQPAWQVFKKYPDVVDLLAAIPINKAWTTTPVDLSELARIVNDNRFVRRLQVYPELQPGLMNPTELDPCKDWGTGAAAKLAQRLSDLDRLIPNKAVELIVAGQMGGGDCDGLKQVFQRLYDLQAGGRAVGWGVTVYPYYYGDQDTSVATLSGDIDGVIAGLARHAPPGRAVLPLRVLETGWPSACSAKATPQNQCAFIKSALSAPTNKGSGVKLYVFELQDYINGWTECEKHFGLFDLAGRNKCASCSGCVNPLQ